jgi:phage gp29-like protein
MKLTQFIINAIRGKAVALPKPGQIIVSRPQDSLRDYPSSGLTPSKLAVILRAADEGDMSAAMQLYEEMEEKDAHLFAIAHTRRLAVTGLDWQIVSDADVHDVSDRALADEVAAYCCESLSRIDQFDESLQHLALAVGRNIALAELVWDFVDGALSLREIVPVDFTRIVFDELNQVRILTADAPEHGIEPPENKFVIHTPHTVSDHPQRGGLLRVTAMAYLAKNLALKDWLVFAEVFGMPVRIARYEPSATPDEKRELLHMLESLGSNAAGIFSRAVELQLIEANRGTAGPPYERLVEFLNREMSKAWLGQTLTTDVSGQKGTLTATAVHEQVRQDVLADDLRKEARTIRRDLLAPLTQLQFGPDAPVPHFRRKLKQPLKASELAELIDVAVNRLGARVSAAWAHDALGIPRAGDADPVLAGAGR